MIDEYRYLWESEQQDWVLVYTNLGYGIVNKRTKMALLVADDALENAIIAKMIESGNRVYDSIIDAYRDD